MPPKPIKELILIYAAESGIISSMMDSAKKILKLKGCALCAITHGLAGEKSEWKSCKDELGVPIVTYHLDEIPPDIARVVGNTIPSVLARTDDGLTILLTPEVLQRCRGSVSDFKGRLLFHAAVRDLYLPGFENPTSESIEMTRPHTG